MAHIQYLTQIHLDPGVVRRLPEECARVGITRPLVISDAGVRAAGVLDQALAALGATPHAVFDATPSQPDRGGRARGSRDVRRRTLRRADRGRRRFVDRSGQGRGDRRHARRAAGGLRHHRRRQPADQRSRGAADRGADHRRHRQRSGPRRDPDRRRRPQAGLSQLAPGAQGRPARPRADAGPAAGADRRHRHGRDRALHGDVHGAGRSTPLPMASRSMAWHAAGRTSSAPRATGATSMRAGRCSARRCRAGWRSRRAWAACIRCRTASAA